MLCAFANKELKIIMRAAREEGLHDNGLIESRKFRVLTAEVENIYLTESEIKRSEEHTSELQSR